MATRGQYDLSVVVGTFNRRKRLRSCIESIVQNASVPTRIYVTDAGSTDGTLEYLREIEADNIRVTLGGKKIGQAKAYNDIFADIQTPYTCWLSDDNIVVNGGLDTAVGILNAVPSIGMVGLKVKDVEGPFSAEPYIGGISETGVLNVNQGVLRTELLNRLGGFSEEFRDYGIDPDLTARVLYEGHDIVYTRDIAILHYRDWGKDETLRAQHDKQKTYKMLYRTKYLCAGQRVYPHPVIGYVASGVRRLLSMSARLIGSSTLDRMARDCYNIVLAKHISVLDPIRSYGKDYHLRQHCDRKTAEYYASRFRRAE